MAGKDTKVLALAPGGLLPRWCQGRGRAALGLVAGGSLQLVGMALCRELSACDIEEILKLLDATCPGVREVDITG